MVLRRGTLHLSTVKTGPGGALSCCQATGCTPATPHLTWPWLGEALAPRRERGHRACCLSLCRPAPHLGTIFLWVFWPSFNSAPTTLGDGQHRTVLHTYYSLTASTLSTFALSALVGEHGRLDMVGVEASGRPRDGVREEGSDSRQGPFSRGTG